MKVIHVYQQYFQAECLYNDQMRKAAVVSLSYTYDEGDVKYEVQVNFFPYRDPEDFLETFDAFGSKELYHARGRRSKKREAAMLAELHTHADAVASAMGGVIYWDKPINEARYA